MATRLAISPKNANRDTKKAATVTQDSRGCPGRNCQYVRMRPTVTPTDSPTIRITQG